MKKLAAQGALALSVLATATTSFAAGLTERTMTAPAAQVAKARAVNSRWMELYLPEKEYNAVTVKELVRYTITSADDAAFAGGIKPIVVQNRHWPETAPQPRDFQSTCGTSPNVIPFAGPLTTAEHRDPCQGSATARSPTMTP